MARPGVTYEEVKAKAEELLALGISPTQRLIRAALGTGSMETISRHLRQFWSERNGEDWEFAISREFSAAIQAEFTRIATTTSSELAGRARQAELELEESIARFMALTAAHAEEQQRLRTVEQDLRGAEAVVAELRNSEAVLRDDVRAANRKLIESRDEIQRLTASAERAKSLESELQEARAMLLAAQSHVSTLLDENKELRAKDAGRRKRKAPGSGSA
ncbi:DNA-binding protein [Cupriavidus pinatubonensis]|uniref:KfrA N-terminal DNA-binding domain-containing protein n=1 Tax=Cupriavidus pinatubonensis TaxID=248026 RepID=A0ABM8XSJ4_9BURK|nr:DNA-binding protein [Cupriavidus pinatubonensis]CAG9183304.1 hypothetical protein LMG23994_05111 [Cupriavidus pinatubonensis]